MERSGTSYALLSEAPKTSEGSLLPDYSVIRAANRKSQPVSWNISHIRSFWEVATQFRNVSVYAKGAKEKHSDWNKPDRGRFRRHNPANRKLAGLSNEVGSNLQAVHKPEKRIMN